MQKVVAVSDVIERARHQTLGESCNVYQSREHVEPTMPLVVRQRLRVAICGLVASERPPNDRWNDEEKHNDKRHRPDDVFRRQPPVSRRTAKEVSTEGYYSAYPEEKPPRLEQRYVRERRTTVVEEHLRRSEAVHRNGGIVEEETDMP